MHNWQQCSVTISEDILTTKIRLHSISDRFHRKALITNSIITTRVLWLENSVAHMRLISPRNHQVGTLLKRHTMIPYLRLHNTQWHRGRGNSLNATSANFSTRRTQSGGIPVRDVCRMFTTVLKIAPGFPIHVGKLRHDKDKCTRF